MDIEAHKDGIIWKKYSVAKIIIQFITKVKSHTVINIKGSDINFRIGLRSEFKIQKINQINAKAVSHHSTEIYCGKYSTVAYTATQEAIIQSIIFFMKFIFFDYLLYNKLS